MKNLLIIIKNNFVYFLAGLAILVALISIFIGQSRPIKTLPATQPIPVFNPSPKPSEAGQQYQKITPQVLEQLKKDELVSHLVEKLPYKGANFSLEYDYSTNQFFYSLTPGGETEGTKEFDLFLRGNQIEDRSWLKNLVLKSK